jgi:uncharacterized membrane protein (UPF0127 family)
MRHEPALRAPRLGVRHAPLFVILVAAGLAAAFALPRQVNQKSGCDVPHVAFNQPDNPSVFVEVADDPRERALGLMYRESLDPDWGMLFVFETPTRAAFWMKDTLVPLSIAFVAADGTVVDVQDMAPLTLDPHGPLDQYKYALEVNAGWFAERGIGQGSVASICLPLDTSDAPPSGVSY